MLLLLFFYFYCLVLSIYVQKAAAHTSCSGYSSLCCLCLYFVSVMPVSHLYEDNTGKYMYDRQFLLNKGRSLIYANTSVPVEALKQLGLLRRSAATAATPTPTARGRVLRKRRERAQKRGKRGGVAVRLKASPHRPAIPSMMLANVRSLDTQLDELKLRMAARREIRDCCAYVFTETWLNDRIPDTAVQLDGFSLHRADRVTSLSGKTKGGGVCIYINTAWCKDAAIVSKHCSERAEFLLL